MNPWENFTSGMIRGVLKCLLIGISMIVLESPATAGTVIGRIRLSEFQSAPEYDRLIRRYSVPGMKIHEFAAQAECASLAFGLKIAKGGTIEDAMVSLVSRPSDQLKRRRNRKLRVIKTQAAGFEPRVLVIGTGERVAFVNGLRRPVRIESASKKENLTFLLSRRGKRKIVRFSQPAMESIRSPGHPWMRATIRAFDHPLFTTSSPRGIFRIEGVPPGPRTVQYWHEFLGTGEKRIMVPREGISRVRLTIPLPIKLRLEMKKCAGP